MTTMFTTPIKTTQNDLDLVGGKGRSLARMSCADFDVPGGFLVTTDAYKKFIADSDLKSKIIEPTAPLNGTPMIILLTPLQLSRRIKKPCFWQTT